MSERGPKRVTIVEGMGQRYWDTRAAPELPGIWSEKYVRADIADELIAVLMAVRDDIESEHALSPETEQMVNTVTSKVWLGKSNG